MQPSGQQKKIARIQSSSMRANFRKEVKSFRVAVAASESVAA